MLHINKKNRNKNLKESMGNKKRKDSTIVEEGARRDKMPKSKKKEALYEMRNQSQYIKNLIQAHPVLKNKRNDIEPNILESALDINHKGNITTPFDENYNEAGERKEPEYEDIIENEGDGFKNSRRFNDGYKDDSDDVYTDRGQTFEIKEKNYPEENEDNLQHFSKNDRDDNDEQKSTPQQEFSNFEKHHYHPTTVKSNIQSTNDGNDEIKEITDTLEDEVPQITYAHHNRKTHPTMSNKAYEHTETPTRHFQKTTKNIENIPSATMVKNKKTKTKATSEIHVSRSKPVRKYKPISENQINSKELFEPTSKIIDTTIKSNERLPTDKWKSIKTEKKAQSEKNKNKTPTLNDDDKEKSPNGPPDAEDILDAKYAGDKKVQEYEEMVNDMTKPTSRRKKIKNTFAQAVEKKLSDEEEIQDEKEKERNNNNNNKPGKININIKLKTEDHAENKPTIKPMIAQKSSKDETSENENSHKENANVHNEDVRFAPSDLSEKPSNKLQSNEKQLSEKQTNEKSVSIPPDVLRESLKTAFRDLASEIKYEKENSKGQYNLKQNFNSNNNNQWNNTNIVRPEKIQALQNLLLDSQINQIQPTQDLNSQINQIQPTQDLNSQTNQIQPIQDINSETKQFQPTQYLSSKTNQIQSTQENEIGKKNDKFHDTLKMNPNLMETLKNVIKDNPALLQPSKTPEPVDTYKSMLQAFKDQLVVSTPNEQLNNAPPLLTASNAYDTAPKLLDRGSGLSVNPVIHYTSYFAPAPMEPTSTSYETTQSISTPGLHPLARKEIVHKPEMHEPERNVLMDQFIESHIPRVSSLVSSPNLVSSYNSAMFRLHLKKPTSENSLRRQEGTTMSSYFNPCNPMPQCQDNVVNKYNQGGQDNQDSQGNQNSQSSQPILQTQAPYIQAARPALQAPIQQAPAQIIGQSPPMQVAQVQAPQVITTQAPVVIQQPQQDLKLLTADTTSEVIKQERPINQNIDATSGRIKNNECNNGENNMCGKNENGGSGNGYQSCQNPPCGGFRNKESCLNPPCTINYGNIDMMSCPNPPCNIGVGMDCLCPNGLFQCPCGNHVNSFSPPFDPQSISIQTKCSDPPCVGLPNAMMMTDSQQTQTPSMGNVIPMPCQYPPCNPLQNQLLQMIMGMSQIQPNQICPSPPCDQSKNCMGSTSFCNQKLKDGQSSQNGQNAQPKDSPRPVIILKQPAAKPQTIVVRKPAPPPKITRIIKHNPPKVIYATPMPQRQRVVYAPPATPQTIVVQRPSLAPKIVYAEPPKRKVKVVQPEIEEPEYIYARPKIAQPPVVRQPIVVAPEPYVQPQPIVDLPPVMQRSSSLSTQLPEPLSEQVSASLNPSVVQPQRILRPPAIAPQTIGQPQAVAPAVINQQQVVAKSPMAINPGATLITPKPVVAAQPPQIFQSQSGVVDEVPVQNFLGKIKKLGRFSNNKALQKIDCSSPMYSKSSKCIQAFRAEVNKVKDSHVLKTSDNIEKLVKGLSQRARAYGGYINPSLEDKISDYVAEAIVDAKRSQDKTKIFPQAYRLNKNKLDETRGFLRHEILPRLNELHFQRSSTDKKIKEGQNLFLVHEVPLNFDTKLEPIKNNLKLNFDARVFPTNSSFKSKVTTVHSEKKEAHKMWSDKLWEQYYLRALENVLPSTGLVKDEYKQLLLDKAKFENSKNNLKKPKITKEAKIPALHQSLPLVGLLTEHNTLPFVKVKLENSKSNAEKPKISNQKLRLSPSKNVKNQIKSKHERITFEEAMKNLENELQISENVIESSYKGNIIDTKPQTAAPTKHIKINIKPVTANKNQLKLHRENTNKYPIVTGNDDITDFSKEKSKVMKILSSSKKFQHIMAENAELDNMKKNNRLLNKHHSAPSMFDFISRGKYQSVLNNDWKHLNERYLYKTDPRKAGQKHKGLGVSNEITTRRYPTSRAAFNSKQSGTVISFLTDIKSQSNANQLKQHQLKHSNLKFTKSELSNFKPIKPKEWKDGIKNYKPNQNNLKTLQPVEMDDAIATLMKHLHPIYAENKKTIANEHVYKSIPKKLANKLSERAMMMLQRTEKRTSKSHNSPPSIMNDELSNGFDADLYSSFTEIKPTKFYEVEYDVKRNNEIAVPTMRELKRMAIELNKPNTDAVKTFGKMENKIENVITKLSEIPKHQKSTRFYEKETVQNTNNRHFSEPLDNKLKKKNVILIEITPNYKNNKRKTLQKPIRRKNSKEKKSNRYKKRRKASKHKRKHSNKNRTKERKHKRKHTITY